MLDTINGLVPEAERAGKDRRALIVFPTGAPQLSICRSISMVR